MSTTVENEQQPATDDGRSAWALVMRREVMAKVTDKSFLIGTLVTVALIVAYLGFVTWQSNRTTEFTLVTTADQESMAQAVSAGAKAGDDDTKVEITRADNEAAATQDLEDESADAWLHQEDGAWVLTFHNEEDGDLTTLVRTVVASETLQANAAAQGVDLAELQKNTEVRTALMEGDADKANVATVVGFAFAFLFYLASILFGMQLATSVVEEKQSRIVEIIAAAIPLRHLLIGKILGNTVLAMGQVLVYAAVGLVGLTFTDYSSFLPSLSGPVVWFLLFFLAGFIALSCLWAVAGALASRNEDLQSTTTPLTMTLVFVFIAALSVDGSAERVLSFVPPFSAILMPQRLLADDLAWWEPVASIAILLACAGALVLVGERIYRRALLQTSGKVSLKQAWRTEE